MDPQAGFAHPQGNFGQGPYGLPEPEPYYRSAKNTEGIKRPDNPFASGRFGGFGQQEEFGNFNNGVEDNYDFELPAFLRPDYKDPSEVAAEEEAAAAEAAAAEQAATEAPMVVEA